MSAAQSFVFGPRVSGDLDYGATLEWLVADGSGGYAMGTVNGLRTRRYHGLLVVSGATPAHRRVALAALDPVLELASGAVVRLGTHEWGSGTVAPQGYRYLERFDLTDGLPRWRWRVGEVVLERELAIRPAGPHGGPVLGVAHRLLAGPPVTLRLEALCTWRDAHGERGASGPEPVCVPVADGVTVEGAYRLHGPGWVPAGTWWRDVYTREEAARGLAAREDLWHAGTFTAALAGAGACASVLAWAGDLAATPAGDAVTGDAVAGAIVAGARRRAAGVVAAADPPDATGAALALAADAFVVRPGGTGTPDVVAGYPWFGAWSRDTMISYEGLFLATGRAELGRELLLGYADTVSQGMLANTADTGQVQYNTVDATLWYVHAVGRYVAVTGDDDLAVRLRPVMAGIVAAHLAGTRYGIRVDRTDSLLTQGLPGYALTWMDARVDGAGVTPRLGKPVEVNALWINALGTVCALHARTGDDDRAVRTLADTATASFQRRFPSPRGWLYDVVDGTGPAGPDDPALRPNQYLAYALPYGPLRGQTPAPAAAAALLTPLGLRTLAPDDPAYQDRHRGDSAHRDRAYHQGTVWPWLIGSYVDTQRAAGLPTTGLLDGLVAHLGEAGLGSVSETADGQAPHRPTGCPFQAWSVAETLRAHRTTSTTS